MKIMWSSFFAYIVRSDIDAEIVQSEVAYLPGAYVPLSFDVTDASAIKAAAKRVSSALRGAKLVALINNAGRPYKDKLRLSQVSCIDAVHQLPDNKGRRWSLSSICQHG